MSPLDWIRRDAVGELWAEMSFVLVTEKQWDMIEAKLSAR